VRAPGGLLIGESGQCFLRYTCDAFAAVPLASAASGSLFFACPKKRNQKKGHPGVPVAGHPVRRLRERVTGFVDGTSCADDERACIPARAPSGLFLHPLAGTQGNPGWSERALLRAQSDVRRGLLDHVALPTVNARAFRHAPLAFFPPPARHACHRRAFRCVALLVLCSSNSPRRPAGGGRNGPQGGRDGSRPLRRQCRDALSAQPADVRGPAGLLPAGGRRGVSFSLVTFSWTSKRKSPARRRGERNPSESARTGERSIACSIKSAIGDKMNRPAHREPPQRKPPPHVLRCAPPFSAST
jgi:hypothetical protein